jgi:L-alanine-DL-glutamate epimerase-like enolase superfamily enzyme
VCAALRDVSLDAWALDDPLAALATPAVTALPGAARFAIETALCDLVARRRGVALHRVLSGRSPEGPVPVNAYVGAALDTTLLAATCDALTRGITTIKVKLTGDTTRFDAELDALHALRDAVPGAWQLRLDLNARWTLADATHKRFAALAALRPSFVEQPVAVGALRALGRVAVPWAIDESLGDIEDTETVFAGGPTGGCIAAVVKPAVHGLLGALALAKRAHTAGLGVVVTHLFDGPVALATACELCLALPTPWACGLDVHAGLAAWPTWEVPQRREAPVVRASGAHGHGVSVAGLTT